MSNTKRTINLDSDRLRKERSRNRERGRMIRFFIDCYIFILLADALLSYLPQFRYQIWAQKINQAANWTLKPVRRLLPRELPFDISPLIVILALQLFIFLF